MHLLTRGRIDGRYESRVGSMIPHLLPLRAALLLVSPSPEVRVGLLVDGDPETIGISSPAAPGKLSAVTVNAPPMLVSGGSGSSSIWY
jgi:hypothetical protein